MSEDSTFNDLASSMTSEQIRALADSIHEPTEETANAEWRYDLPGNKTYAFWKVKVGNFATEGKRKLDLFDLLPEQGKPVNINKIQHCELARTTYHQCSKDIEWSSNAEEAEKQKIALCTLVIQTIVEEVMKVREEIEEVAKQKH